KHRIDIKTGLGMMLHGYDQKAFDNQYHPYVEYKEKYDQIKFTIAVQSQYKINSKIRLRSGLILNQQYFNLNQNIANKNKELVNYLSAKDNTQILQAYSQLQYRAGRKWTVNPGIHAVYLTLNKTASVEPRLGIKYQLGAKNWLSAGYGIHSQVQSLAAYTVKNTAGAMPNKNLKLSQAQHFILGYDRVFGKSWHVKMEGYFQQLYNLPVSPETGNTFGLVNSFEGYYQDTLVSKGKGQNKGVEITLEKFFTGSTYLLFTASLSDSKYTDGHGKEYSTRFDIGHTLSVSAGKEWRIHQNRLGLNTKIMWLGGMRETPIDVAASKLQETTVRDLTRTFEGQNPDYFRADIKISYKINKKRHSSTWSLDIQNSSNHKNIGGSYFDPKAGKLVYYTQAPLIPILAYKLEF
ncbi:MAG: TonB-dependent receptor, partial [Bacteroidia bacterium]|nr:TonB-dependent receptor [Bacteroidia bacterium]